VSVAILKFIGCLMGSQCRLERCRLAGPLDYPHLRLDRRIAVNQFFLKNIQNEMQTAQSETVIIITRCIISVNQLINLSIYL